MQADARLGITLEQRRVLGRRSGRRRVAGQPWQVLKWRSHTVSPPRQQEKRGHQRSNCSGHGGHRGSSKTRLRLAQFVQRCRRYLFKLSLRPESIEASAPGGFVAHLASQHRRADRARVVVVGVFLLHEDVLLHPRPLEAEAVDPNLLANDGRPDVLVIPVATDDGVPALHGRRDGAADRRPEQRVIEPSLWAHRGEHRCDLGGVAFVIPLASDSAGPSQAAQSQNAEEGSRPAPRQPLFGLLPSRRRRPLGLQAIGHGLDSHWSDGRDDSTQHPQRGGRPRPVAHARSGSQCGQLEDEA
mmetsp:Transcript_8427/g.21602  ORF Transcript_8427/g.21602 Transcript_8427/m.21602 type:complete len:300 (-) Transcript_8427:7-906(-)